MYLDPVRFEFSGDLDRARTYAHEARRILFGLKRRIAESGIDSARSKRVMGDGTVIEVILTGAFAMAHITAPTAGGGGEETIAYIAFNGTTPPRVAIFNMDQEKEVRYFTGLGSVVNLAMHPNGKDLFALTSGGILAKVDVQKLTATSIDTGLFGLSVDMGMSPDAERVFVRYRATGIPGQGGFYGGVWHYATSNLAYVGANPETLQSASQYRTTVRKDDRIYLTVYGDGDGDPETNPSGSNHRSAVEAYDWQGGFVAGAPLLPEHVASSRHFKELAVSPQQNRLYVASDVGSYFFPGQGVSPIPFPSVKVFDISGNGIVEVAALLEGVDLNGSIAVARTGGHAFVMSRSTGMAYAISATNQQRTTFAVSDPFEVRPEDTVGIEGAANRAIQIGPDRGADPDTRVFFLSTAGKTLRAFKIGSTTPDKKVAFNYTPHTYTLGKAL